MYNCFVNHGYLFVLEHQQPCEIRHHTIYLKRKKYHKRGIARTKLLY